MAGNVMSYRDSRVEELKQVSGNWDISQGGVASGSQRPAPLQPCRKRAAS